MLHSRYVTFKNVMVFFNLFAFSLQGQEVYNLARKIVRQENAKIDIEQEVSGISIDFYGFLYNCFQYKQYILALRVCPVMPVDWFIIFIDCISIWAICDFRNLHVCNTNYCVKYAHGYILQVCSYIYLIIKVHPTQNCMQSKFPK